MQGQKSSVSTLLENVCFDHGSTSSDAGIESQVPWNNMQTSAEVQLPEYMIPSSETNNQYLHHVEHREWILGETSSGAAQSQSDDNERTREHTWIVHSQAVLNLDECSLESSDHLSLDTVDVNEQVNQTSNGTSLMQISGPTSVSQDLHSCSEFGDQEDAECQVIEHPNRHRSLGSSNEKRPTTGGSSDTLDMFHGCSEYIMEDSDYRPDCSLDGRRLSCKRKALEVQIGQSSGAGSPNCSEHAERSQCLNVTAAQISAINVSLPISVANNLVFSNGPEQENLRTRLGVGGVVSSDPLSSNARGTAESSHRNFRLRMSGSDQQDHMPGIPLLTEANAGNLDVCPSEHSSRFVFQNRLLEFNPTPSAQYGSRHSQPVSRHVPSERRSSRSRWGGASSSRTSYSSSAGIAIGRLQNRERDRDPILYEESTPANIPRSISEHPLFVHASEMGGSSQQSTDWNLSGGSNNVTGAIASTSRAGSSSRTNSSSPSPFWFHRSFPQYPRRLSEIVRRTLLSEAGTESGDPSSSSAIQSSSPGTSQGTALSSGSGNHVPHSSNTRSSSLERHLDDDFGLPYSLQSFAASSEGRRSIMSEIRHVLDLMRRGEGLRFEDMMMLDHSFLVGMADVHDRHRDMRLDVDNMSYEELLALEDRIGNVCTGLKEETIMSRLKQRKYAEGPADQVETEPCSICREEYNDGEDLGTLECGHDFHRDCVKQWLLLKNLCPICKTAALST